MSTQQPTPDPRDPSATVWDRAVVPKPLYSEIRTYEQPDAETVVVCDTDEGETAWIEIDSLFVSDRANVV